MWQEKTVASEWYILFRSSCSEHPHLRWQKPWSGRLDRKRLGRLGQLHRKGVTPLDIRPICLSPLIYRIWAKTRFQQLQAWHAAWLPEHLHGGAPGKETTDCYYKLAMEIEYSHTQNHPLFAIFWDYAKCFDNVAWTIESGLLKELGMPMPVHDAMFSFSASIMRRFKFGNSVGPSFPNTNSIMQGCPLAIIRINALLSAWANAFSSNPDTALCQYGVYFDDKNARATSCQQLQQVIDFTADFDRSVDAVVNYGKTTAFSTSPAGRKEVRHITIDGHAIATADAERLLGAQLSFTKKRDRALANQRAMKYLAAAERISLCPLNISARHTLLTSAGASKYTFGLELGACDRKLESALRSKVLSALWRGRSIKSSDIAFTLCFKGHRIDPVQLRVICPFVVARRQLIKFPDIRPFWQHLWFTTERQRAKIKDGRSNAVGPLLVMQSACNSLSWEWISPFEFRFSFGHGLHCTLNILTPDTEYFLHILRLGASRMLWQRAASQRKELRGIQHGIDKTATLSVLNRRSLLEYDRGILRSILACAIYTQRHLFKTQQADHPICPYCWEAEETLIHLFWRCPKWQHIRTQHLTPAQLQDASQLPPATLRTGIFLLTPHQAAAAANRHDSPMPAQRHAPVHPCTYHTQCHLMMIHIVKTRNEAEPVSPPDDFDPSAYNRYPAPPDPLHPSPALEPPQKANANRVRDQPQPAAVDGAGLLLSTSLRPGASKYQYVQKNEKSGLFRAVISYKGKRQSFGPFATDTEAACRVKEFFEQVRNDCAPLSRGEKRSEKFEHSIDDQLRELNGTARQEGRHLVPSLSIATCSFCNKTIHKYHVIKFVQNQCTAISKHADKSGSLTRANKLSQTRTAALQAKVDAHNSTAAERGQHHIASILPMPKCTFCNQVVTRNYVSKWMIKSCPCAPSPLEAGSVPKISRRIRGKSNPLA